MKCFPLLFTFFFTCAEGFSQYQAPDSKINQYSLKSIEKSFLNEEGPFYFDDLIFEFERGDTLTESQLMHIYFGSAFLTGYAPFKYVKFENDITFLSNQKEFNKVKLLTDSLLLKHPTSLIGNLERCYALQKSNDTLEAITYRNRYRQLKNLILSTGNGQSPEMAMWVTSIKDIDPIMQEKGWMVISFKEQEIDDHFYQVYKIYHKSGTKRKIYFNIDLPMIIGLKD